VTPQTPCAAVDLEQLSQPSQPKSVKRKQVEEDPWGAPAAAASEGALVIF